MAIRLSDIPETQADPQQASKPIRLSDIPDQSVVHSEPISQAHHAQRRLDEVIAQTPQQRKRSLIPQGVGSFVGGMTAERIANQLTQRLPPKLKYLGVPIRIGAAAIGDFLGGASGRGYQQLAEGEVGPGMFGEQLGSGATEAVYGLVGNVGGGLFGRVLQGGVPGVAKRQLGNAQELSDTLTGGGVRAATGDFVSEMSEHTVQSLAAGKARLTEGERGRSVITAVERFARSAIGGGKLNDTLKDLNPAAIKQLKQELVDQYWKEVGATGRQSADDVALEISEVIDRNMSGFRQRFSTKILNGKKPLDSEVVGDIVGASRATVVKHNKGQVSKAYGKVEQLAVASGIASQDVGEIVPLTESFKAANEIAEKWANMGESTLKNQMLDLADVILTGSPKTTIENADKGIRSQLLAESRKLDVAGSTRSKNEVLNSALKKLQKAVGDDLASELNKFDPAINEALEEARGLAEKNIRMENHPFVKKMHTLIETSRPEDLIDHIFKDGSPTGIELAQRSLGRETVAELADTWLNKQVTESMANKQSIGIEMKKRLNKLGRPSLDKIYGKKKTNDLYAVASTFKKEGSAFLESKAVKGALNLVDSNPALVAHRLIQKDNTRLMQKWKTQLGPKRFKKVQAVWLGDVLEKGSFKKTWDDLGPKMQRATFSDPAHLKSIQKVAELDGILGKASDGSSVLAKLIQAGAVTAFATAPGKAVKGGAAFTATGIAMVGQLLANKEAAKWIARGVDNPRQLNDFIRRATVETIRRVRLERREQEIKKQGAEREKRNSRFSLPGS